MSSAILPASHAEKPHFDDSSWHHYLLTSAALKFANFSFQNKYTRRRERALDRWAPHIHPYLLWCLAQININIWSYLPLSIFPALPFFQRHPVIGTSQLVNLVIKWEAFWKQTRESRPNWPSAPRLFRRWGAWVVSHFGLSPCSLGPAAVNLVSHPSSL